MNIAFILGGIAILAYLYEKSQSTVTPVAPIITSPNQTVSTMSTGGNSALSKYMLSPSDMQAMLNDYVTEYPAVYQQFNGTGNNGVVLGNYAVLYWLYRDTKGFGWPSAFRPIDNVNQDLQNGGGVMTIQELATQLNSWINQNSGLSGLGTIAPRMAFGNARPSSLDILNSHLNRF